MSNQNQQFVVPTGQLQGSFVAPSNTGKEKRTDIRNLNQGLNPASVYGVVELGTHMESFQGGVPSPKKKIQFMFEFPQLKQLFYVDDTEVKSTSAYKESTISLGNKAFMTTLIKAVAGRAMSANELSTFDISQCLGATIGVNINLVESKKTAGVFYNNVDSVVSLGAMQPGPEFKPENKRLFFFIDRDPQQNVIGNNFMSQNFADLPFFLKKKIMESAEGVAYAQRGGKFAENQNKEQIQEQNQQQAQQNYGNPHLNQNKQAQQQFAPQQQQQVQQQPMQNQQAPQQQVQQQPMQNQQQAQQPQYNPPQQNAGGNGQANFNPNQPDDLPF